MRVSGVGKLFLVGLPVCSTPNLPSASSGNLPLRILTPFSGVFTVAEKFGRGDESDPNLGVSVLHGFFARIERLRKHRICWAIAKDDRHFSPPQPTTFSAKNTQNLTRKVRMSSISPFLDTKDGTSNVLFKTAKRPMDNTRKWEVFYPWVYSWRK